MEIQSNFGSLSGRSEWLPTGWKNNCLPPQQRLNPKFFPLPHDMRYGSWISDGTPAEVVDGKLKSFQFSFNPEIEGEPDDQTFHSPGTLSSMISSAFRELTVENDGVVSMDVRYDPAFFNLQIPENYKCHCIPINQIRARNYPLFSMVSCASNFHTVSLIPILYP